MHNSRSSCVSVLRSQCCLPLDTGSIWRSWWCVLKHHMYPNEFLVPYCPGPILLKCKNVGLSFVQRENYKSLCPIASSCSYGMHFARTDLESQSCHWLEVKAVGGCLTFLSVTSISVCVRLYLIERSKASFFLTVSELQHPCTLQEGFSNASNSIGISDFLSHEKIFIKRNLTRCQRYF